MNDYNRRRSDRAVRVQTFGREHAADFTAGSKASALFAEMDTLFSIDTLLTKAQTLVTRLDAAILNKFARHPDKLAARKSATHVERGPKKEQQAEPTPPPPAT